MSLRLLVQIGSAHLSQRGPMRDATAGASLRPKLVCALTLVMAASMLGATGVAFAAAAPSVAGEQVSEVTPATAILHATVNPEGEETTYRFEYGPTEAYGDAAPSSEASAGNGALAVAVEAHIEGLTPGTLYHYRVVAKNATGTTFGADRTLRARPRSTGLPDGRAYEMVTPVDNSDANAYDPGALIENYGEFDTPGEAAPFLVAPSGEALTFPGDPSPEGGGGAMGVPFANQYVISRASGNWVETNITAHGRNGSVFQGFNPTLTDSVFKVGGRYNEPSAYLEEAPAGYKILYAREASGSEHSLIRAAAMLNKPFKFEFIDNFAGGSADFKELLFESNAQLMPAAAEEGHNLYEEGPGRGVELVNVVAGKEITDARFGAPSNGENEEQFRDEGTANDYSHDISRDGRRVFWSSVIPEGQPEEGQPSALYMHEPGKLNIQIDASQAGGPGGHGRFWTATPEGTEVFLTDDATAKLTSDTEPGSGANLYAYDAASGELTDLTPVAEAGVVSVLGTGEGSSGQYIYFAANGVLAPGATAGDCGAGRESERAQRLCNIYVLHDGTTKFIATVSAVDGFAFDSDFVSSLAGRRSEVSPTGEALLFGSRQNLTGYENEGEQEVYVYRPGRAELSCVSCDPSNAAIQPQTAFDVSVPHSGEWLGAFVPRSFSETESGRWMSDNGDVVFFDSSVPLVPQATNGLINVYEWEAEGSGTCNTEGGCVSLLSSGRSDDNSYLYGSSESGNDVYFITRSELVASDGNEFFNVFDARADAPAQVQPPACTGTGCQGVAAPPPVFATPATVTFEGVGNFPPPAKEKAKSKPRKSSTKKRHPKLVRALARCKAEKGHKRRVSCERLARQRDAGKATAKGGK